MSDSPAPLDPNLPVHYEPAPIGEVERLRRELAELRRVLTHVCESALKYDAAVFQAASKGQRWVDDAGLDALYEDWQHKAEAVLGVHQYDAQMASLRPSASVPRRLDADEP